METDHEDEEEQEQEQPPSSPEEAKKMKIIPYAQRQAWLIKELKTLKCFTYVPDFTLDQVARTSFSELRPKFLDYLNQHQERQEYLYSQDLSTFYSSIEGYLFSVHLNRPLTTEEITDVANCNRNYGHRSTYIMTGYTNQNEPNLT